jgi:hypothetical protein
MISDLSPWFQALRRVMRPWQRDHIARSLHHKYGMWIGARQEVGKTFSQSALAIMLGAGYTDTRTGLRIPGHDVYLVSADQQRSMDMVRRVGQHLDAAAKGGIDWRDPKLGSQQRIALKNGRYIRAMTSDPTNLQGVTGSVIIDELSLSDDPEALYTQALSVSSRSPHFRVVASTNASGAGDWLASFVESEQYRERRAVWDIHRTTIADIYPGDLPEHMEIIRQALSDEAWRRFFRCEFIGAENPLLSAKLRDACADPATIWFAPYKAKRWLSVDIGASSAGDSTAALELSQHGARIQVDRIHQWWESDTMATADRIAEIAGRIGAAWIDVDGQGVGRGVADRLVSLGLPVRRLATMDASRAAGADALLSLAQRGLITWSHAQGDAEREELARDIAIMGREESAPGVCKSVTVPRRKLPNGRISHCDIGDALLQALGVTSTTHAGGFVTGPTYRRTA